MTLGQQLPDHNTSVTTTACATSWILRHRRQHHRRDHTIAETTPSQRPCHRRDNTIAETMPSQRRHHRRDLTIAETTHRRDHLGTEHLADQNPRTWTPITDHSGPNETPRTTPSQRASPGYSAPCGKRSKDLSNQCRPHWTTTTQRTHLAHPNVRHTTWSPPPRSFSIKGGKDVSHSYLLEPTRPARHFYCTCQNLP